MKIIFYSFPNGISPVRDDIDAILDLKLKVKVFRTIQLLQQYGMLLEMPYAEHLDHKIWQLRAIQSSNIYRILYFCDCDNAVLTNGFLKKTQKTPKQQIETAKERMNDYFRRKNDG